LVPVLNIKLESWQAGGLKKMFFEIIFQKEMNSVYSQLSGIKPFHFFVEKNKMTFCKFGSFRGKAFKNGLLASDKRAQVRISVGAALITLQRQTVENNKFAISLDFLSLLC
jgi:hypothetical protein